ncbi:TPA: ParB/RepB/Spo0J family partition protein [Shewanella algae]|uniref:ParB/RepB/Spo0J family partition protein n=1 Tax=Shewanella TaxID=22 RepID=UPI00142FD5EA|nr:MULTISPECIES: ParB/RepB/Spo0J family partition protein [Shewanella]NJI86983.1 ParB/RepB/Spo0J family partition protein [Shewanella sp. Iso12]HDS1208398.1 ParB/RepB/Spo0J family partition protein [Shewanella algae]
MNDDFMSLISSVNNDGAFRLVEGHYSSCYPDVSQPRYKNLTPEGCADILATFSITKGRLYQPIVVWEKDDKGHKILMGGRRWLSVKTYAEDKKNDFDGMLPMLIVQHDIEMPLFLQLMENISRKALDPREEGRSFVALKESYKLKQKEIAQSLGKSETYVSECILMYNTETDRKLKFIHNLFEKELCQDLSTLAILTRLAQVDPNKTESLVNWAIENNSLTRSWAKSLSKKDFEQSSEDIIKALDDKSAANNKKSPKKKAGAEEEPGSNVKPGAEEEPGSNVKPGAEEEPGSNVKPGAEEELGSDKFKLEQETDGEVISQAKRKKVTLINVLHNDRAASIVLDSVAEEGFCWIEYDTEKGQHHCVDLGELSIVYVG